MAYIGKSPTGSGVRQRYVYTATGGETSLSGADDNSKTLQFTDGEYVDVHLNGIQLVQGTDYGVGTANTISGLAALAADDVVEIVVYDVFNVAKINSEAMRNRYYYTATGGETSLTTTQISGLSFPANAEIEVRLNGIALVQGTDFNTTTANTVGGLAALSSGNVVEIVYYEAFQLADVVSKAAGGTYNGQVIADGGLDMNGKELILDADADSKIEASTDDTINIISGGTTALTVNPSGRVSHPTRPILSVRGVATSATLSAADSTFDAATSWTTTDIDVGGLLNSGGYAEVPTGFGGIYQITWISNATTTTNFNSAIIYHYDGTTYTRLILHYGFNDYNGYSTGTTLFYQCDEGDRIYVGHDNRYGIPTVNDYQHNFSMMYVG